MNDYAQNALGYFGVDVAFANKFFKVYVRLTRPVRAEERTQCASRSVLPKPPTLRDALRAPQGERVSRTYTL